MSRSGCRKQSRSRAEPKQRERPPRRPDAVCAGEGDGLVAREPHDANVLALVPARLKTRAYLAVYALVGATSVYFETWAAVSHWLAPMVLTKWTHQLHNLSEHSGLPNVQDVARNTRTVKTNRFMSWLVWNMCFHADHHMFPAVPFYKLPELHAITDPHLKVVEPGYAAFHRGLASRLWREWREAA